MFTGLISTRLFSGTHTYSAWAPYLNPLDPNTWSPSANRVAAWPADSTVPANSIPRMLTFFGLQRPFMILMRKDGSAFLNLQSAGVTVVAWMRTRTSLSLGIGFSTSLTWTTSGGPYLV